jgi:hypothetical protein
MALYGSGSNRGAWAHGLTGSAGDHPPLQRMRKRAVTELGSGSTVTGSNGTVTLRVDGEMLTYAELR